MKVKFIPAIVAVSISALMAWGFYLLGKTESQQYALCAASFVNGCFYLMALMGFSYEENRSGVMMRVAAGVYSIIALGMDIVFSFYEFSIPSFIIPNAVLLLIALLTLYGINNTKQ